MKYYKISDSWFYSIDRNEDCVSLYLRENGTGSVLSSDDKQKLVPRIGDEITQEEFISIFNQIIINYENYFKSESSDQAIEDHNRKV